MFLEEMGITRGDDGITGEKPGMSVIGMKAVTLPRVMAEHDLRFETPNMSGYLTTEFSSIGKVSVNLLKKNQIKLRQKNMQHLWVSLPLQLLSICQIQLQFEVH